MGGTYKAIGINLKGTPLGESDRLLTILTDEYGLIRVVAPGSRKHKSSLGGRSSLFVVNQLLLAKGQTLDKIIQAESIESFPKLSQDLCKLTAAQYLAELALFQALSDQAQTDLFSLLRGHLSRIEKFPAAVTLPSLIHATFHLLALAGLTPQLHACCVSQQRLAPAVDHPNWQVGFSVMAGGTVSLDHLDQLPKAGFRVATPTGNYSAENRQASPSPKSPDFLTRINAVELTLLQQLTQPNLIQDLLDTQADLLHPQHYQNWLTLERVLRHYAQYHFDRPIRSAALIETCFASVDAPLPCVNHDAIV